jgi:predicted nucleic acid-binding protein
VKKRYLMDSFAIISYLSKEGGFEKVREIMSGAQESGINALMNEVNVGEVFYILSRRRGVEDAVFFLETILSTLPVTLVPNTLDDVIDAARIKAEYPLSFADCFAVATAQKKDVVILTGDCEFKKVSHLVDVEWLV